MRSITFDLEDALLGAKQAAILRDSLSARSDEELEQALTRLAKTATAEYLCMLLENGMATRAEEMRQDRLYFLLTYFYKDRFPSEAEVCALFQITPAESATLLRKTRSRYRTRLDELVAGAVRRTLESARRNGASGRFEMVIDSAVLVEELKAVIHRKGPALRPIRKKAGSAGQYEAEEDTIRLLRREYGLQ